MLHTPEVSNRQSAPTSHPLNGAGLHSSSLFDPLPFFSASPSVSVSSHATSGSLRPGSVVQSTSSSRSSTKRKRADAGRDIIDDRLGGLGNPGMSSAIVGMTGAMNNLSTTIHHASMQSGVSVAQRVTHLISGAEYLTPDEKARLFFYFVNRPNEASPLVDMDPEFRKAIFQMVLQNL